MNFNNNKEIFFINLKKSQDFDKFFDKKKVKEIRNNILKSKVLILRGLINKDFLIDIKEYLKNVAGNTLPNYFPINEKSPNFYRINFNDKRSFVKGYFHQFSFFPWNQDLFNIFEEFKNPFILKNMITNINGNKYLNGIEDKITARIAFQFYPSGKGYLNKHSDPYDKHQICVPTIVMSKMGNDYTKGGLFIINTRGKKIFLLPQLDDEVKTRAKKMSGGCLFW